MTDRRRDQDSERDWGRPLHPSEPEYSFLQQPYYRNGPHPVGPNTGRGPRGYRRSDERIREDVSEQLTRHGWIDASEIDVTVENGEVTLSGAVDSRETKRRAEDVADAVPGVRDVHNRLHVSPEISPWRGTVEGQGVGQAEYGNPFVPSGSGYGLKGAADWPNSRPNNYPQSYAPEFTHGRRAVDPARTEEDLHGDYSAARQRRGHVRGRVEEGMGVLDQDGTGIGTVKEVGDRDFLVSRPMARDIYVPLSAVSSVSEIWVMLDIPAGEAEDMDWAHPSIAGRRDER